MTQHRNDPGKISNYFDRLLKGIGHRGSSFMDVDAITHDAKTKRWLVQEFKHEGERLDKAQHWMLQDLTTLPAHFSAWIVVKRDDGRIGWADCRDVRATYRVISVEEYQDRFAAWWAGRVYVPPVPSLPPASVAIHVDRRPVEPLMDTDISW